MMRAPGLAAIHAVELRVAQSRRDTRVRLHHARVAFRASLARPVTLGMVAAGAGLFGFWLARGPRAPSRRGSSRTEGAAASPSGASVVAAFVVRYGMQHLPFILQQIMQKRRESPSAERPETDTENANYRTDETR